MCAGVLIIAGGRAHYCDRPPITDFYTFNASLPFYMAHECAVDGPAEGYDQGKTGEEHEGCGDGGKEVSHRAEDHRVQ